MIKTHFMAMFNKMGRKLMIKLRKNVFQVSGLNFIINNRFRFQFEYFLFVFCTNYKSTLTKTIYIACPLSSHILFK